MNLLQFLKTKDFLKHLIIAIVLGIVIFSSSFIFLNIYTQHGESFPLPDFKKLTLKEAKQLADRYSLKIEVTDSVYQDNWPKGTVAKQNPSSEFDVKEGRTIFITMNATTKELVKMPNVVGVSHRHAKAILNNSGLKIGKLVHRPDIAVNNVLEQRVDNKDIKTGKLIPKGTEIDLVLGKGSDERANIPDLAGYPHQKARDRILENAMNVGAVRYDTTINTQEDSAKAFVWQQYPPYEKNKAVKLGAYIDLWITTDSAKLPGHDTTQFKLEMYDGDSLQ